MLIFNVLNLKKKVWKIVYF